ncbi:MAG: antitoxin [Candidatus Brocadia carolinensis]|uniref:Antitoxin n=1 Tax=Candidatus Brocadia carolinensis TaxID=1004156 RepID=A0A1V4AUJ2_9BACT|nr:MAG: antitoxin [Candidatus Brocadia caroliniensis]
MIFLQEVSTWKKKLLKRIEINPKIMFGKPVIKGTRLTVEIILEKLAYGETEDEIRKEYLFLKKDDIKAALLYAAKTISLEETVHI